MKKEDDLILNNNNIIGQKIIWFLETKGNITFVYEFLAYKSSLDEEEILELDFAKEYFKDINDIMICI